LRIKKCDRIVFGILLPVVILIIGMLVLVNVESGADAAEFGGLAVFIMLVISLPITLIANLFIVLLDAQTRKSYFGRGMIVPCIVLIAAVIYQSGLWDKVT